MGTEGRAGRKEEWEAKEEKADREKQREGDRKVKERERGRERRERNDATPHSLCSGRRTL